MAPLRIEVNGDATIYMPAERAVMSISIQCEGKSQEEVSKNVIATSAKIRDLLGKLCPKDAKAQVLPDAPITFWSNASLSTGSYLRYEGKKQLRVHEASTTFEAKFQDFAKLGSVATELSTMQFVRIGNISWRLTDKTRDSVTTKCRHQAVHDAMAKARDFAAAADRPAPPVVEIRDSGSSGVVAYAAAPRMRKMKASFSSAVDQEDLSFTPEDVSLNCSVFVVCQETT